jgi:hypothetical protein
VVGAPPAALEPDKAVMELQRLASTDTGPSLSSFMERCGTASHMREYGGGVVEEVHARLFADAMLELGLDPTYGAHLADLPATTLSTCNLVSLFGLHRRWRGALVGHLALFEMCSVGPMGRYAKALRRLALGAPWGPAARFYEVHVAADARHEVIALDDLVGGLLSDEPHLAGDVVFGARALTAVERRFADALMARWGAGRSSLRSDSRG